MAQGANWNPTGDRRSVMVEDPAKLLRPDNPRDKSRLTGSPVED
jgi:hypothetical protein